jgi:hypothetical protein
VTGADASTESGGSGSAVSGNGGRSSAIAGSGNGGTVVSAGGKGLPGSGGVTTGFPMGGGTTSGPVPMGQYQNDAGVVCTWTAPSIPPPAAPCDPWQGGTLHGVSGLDLSCPCAGSPQQLAYGITTHTPGTTITGPLAEIYDGQIVSCAYEFSWSTGPGNTSWLSLPVFGGGSGRLEVPTGLVSQAMANCSTSPGALVQPSTFRLSAARLAGAWVACPSSTPPLAGSVLRYGGILLNPDGSFQALRNDGTDHFAITDGCDAAGLWGIDPALLNQLDLFTGAFEDIELWTLYDGSPRQMTLDNNGVVTTRLVSVE